MTERPRSAPLPPVIDPTLAGDVGAVVTGGRVNMFGGIDAGDVLLVVCRL